MTSDNLRPLKVYKLSSELDESFLKALFLQCITFNDEIDDAFVSSRGAPFGKGTRLNIPTKNPVKVTLIIMGHLLAL